MNRVREFLRGKKAYITALCGAPHKAHYAEFRIMRSLLCCVLRTLCKRWRIRRYVVVALRIIRWLRMVLSHSDCRNFSSSSPGRKRKPPPEGG